MYQILIETSNRIDSSIKLPEEELNMLNSIKDEARRLESILGRQCIRKALSKFKEYKSYPILKGSTGEPLFPNGILGSIAHTESIAIGAITNDKNIKSIGIDIQNIKEFNASKRMIESNEDNLSRCSLLEILSIKESVYKAIYSLYNITVPYSNIKSSYTEDNFIMSKIDIDTKSLYTDNDIILTKHCIVNDLICSLTIII